jgi:periplasmic divalent cation tolerance protein
VLKLHPYSVPEVLALPVSAGSQPYLDWIAAATS